MFVRKLLILKQQLIGIKVVAITCVIEPVIRATDEH